MICLSEKYKPGRLLEVSGRSMEPTLWDGQIVEVMEGYQDGDIVVAEHEERLIVKRLVGDKLLGDNLVLSTDFFVADVCILGRAEVRTKEELEERGLQLDRLSLGMVYAAWESWKSINDLMSYGTGNSYDKLLFNSSNGNLERIYISFSTESERTALAPIDLSKYKYRIVNTSDDRDIWVRTMNGDANRVLKQGESFVIDKSTEIQPYVTTYRYSWSVSIERDVQNRNPTLTLSTQDDIVVSQGTVTLSGTVSDPDGDTVIISATIGGIKKQTTVTGNGNWSLSWPVSELPQANYSLFYIYATDNNGGTAQVIYPGRITIDKTKPTISVTGVEEGQVYTSATPIFSATDTWGLGIQSCTATLNGNAFTSGTTITTAGNYTLVVTAKDKAGNISTQTIHFKINSAPTVEVSTANNQTLYEGDSLIISGSANDVNVGNALIVKLRFDEEPEKNILVTTSTGDPQPISYTVTFKNGRLYDASNNPITPELNKDVVHSFTVYAKDDSGAESPRIVRQFMVVPNRNPIININPLEPLTSMVPTDTVTISGTVNDPDEGDTVTMEYKLNQGPFQPVTMQGETWSFSISVGDLRDGENIIELKAIDNKGGVTVKRMAIDQTPRIVPVKVSQSRYMILPPKGEMKGLVAWIQRKKGDLQVKGDLSIVATGQPESFVPMEKTSAELSQTLDEDQFIGSVETAGQNVTIKLTETRVDALNSSAAITKIAGVIN
ncbi:Ig-like domain-containing protein [Aneurinibacillus aneurinilyticus]|uniref:Ig-like domain-containing protein n=1 Tax=Aneurinibacillus aneurinilyticus TaxID=1391 RepID=UPI003672B762